MKALDTWHRSVMKPACVVVWGKPPKEKKFTGEVKKHSTRYFLSAVCFLIKILRLERICVTRITFFRFRKFAYPSTLGTGTAPDAFPRQEWC